MQPALSSRREEVSGRFGVVPSEMRSVVGIDVAKTAHVVCALDAPSGAVRLKSTPMPATAAG